MPEPWPLERSVPPTPLRRHPLEQGTWVGGRGPSAVVRAAAHRERPGSSGPRRV